MKAFFARAVLLVIPALAIANSGLADTNTRPAMIASAPDSVASLLHYPPKAKAAKQEAAISFYCEVGANGKPDHLQLYGPDDKTEFRLALQKALRAGRFQPAMSGGQPVPVIVGGTAIFMFRGNQPTIAISLSTADKGKTAALSNYIQPQMLGSSVEFRRKLFRSRYDSDIHFHPRGLHPGATAVVQVDAQGNLVSTKLTAEWPPRLRLGTAIIKGI